MWISGNRRHLNTKHIISEENLRLTYFTLDSKYIGQREEVEDFRKEVHFIEIPHMDYSRFLHELS